MMEIDNKEKITELVGNIGKDNGFISFDKDVLEKTKEQNTILYGSYLSDPSEDISPIQSILNQLKEVKVDDFHEYNLCAFSILCHNADDMTMNDLAKLQTFLSEYINPEAEVTWKYGVDDSLKFHQVCLTFVLG